MFVCAVCCGRSLVVQYLALTQSGEYSKKSVFGQSSSPESPSAPRPWCSTTVRGRNFRNWKANHFRLDSCAKRTNVIPLILELLCGSLLVGRSGVLSIEWFDLVTAKVDCAGSNPAKALFLSPQKMTTGSIISKYIAPSSVVCMHGLT